MSKTALRGPVRVRFAPSPTGFLHVGGARTAIYNELLRQNLGGAFILRIEDTDRARSDQAMIEQICGGLRWIGIEWDEGPFLQSEGVERHREAAQRLLAEGKAYPCQVPQEEMDARRQAAVKASQPARYRDLFERPSPEEVERRLNSGEPYAVRFKSGDADVCFHDLVRGDMTIPAANLDDFIILRSDGSPTYHLSVVCDDVEMTVSHVIRGEDHLSNTPKHIELFRALAAETPVFAHLPLIMGPDKKRLSKRTGATSVEEFRDQGLLPAALYNYLALLGWSPGGDLEQMSREQMIELFTVERLNGSAAVFDVDKLGWMNAQYMSGQPLDELMPYLQPFLDTAGLGDLDEAQQPRLRQALELHRTRTRTLAELAEVVKPYFQERLDYDAELCAKFFKQDELPEQVERLIDAYAALDAFEVEPLETALRATADELGVKAGVLIHPTRMALSGSKAGPSLFDLVAAHGREGALRHLRNFVEYLRSTPVES